MGPNLVVNDPLPTDQHYAGDKVARAFWRLSYRCGRTYTDSKDARGGHVLVKHEREQGDAYSRRQRITKPRNHCGPIIRKYNDYVFRRPAERQSQGDFYDMLCADVDGHRTDLSTFMRHSLRIAQIERECYLLPDSNAPTTDTPRSKAQAAEAGIRPIIRRISPDSVLWTNDRDGQLVCALVLFQDEEGTFFAVVYDETASQRIELVDTRPKDTPVIDKSIMFEFKVKSLGPKVPHGAGGCPLVRHRPMFDDDDDPDTSGESQIAPLAELQQSVLNISSLHMEELYSSVFSQIVVTGESADNVKEAPTGPNRMLCIPNKDAKMTVLGADPAQAVSLRQAVMDEQRELYRIAGIATSDPLEGSGQPESGISRSFKFNDLAANLSALAKSCEDAENTVMRRLYAMNGMDPDAYESAKYPSDFDMPVMADELDVLIRTLTVPRMPAVIVKSIANRFADRNLALQEDDEKELESQLDNMPDETNPLPGGTPKPGQPNLPPKTKPNPKPSSDDEA